MKQFFRRFGPERCWIALFCLCFLSVPLSAGGIPLVLAMLLFGLCALGARLAPRTRFAILLAALSFALRLAAVCIVDTPPESDFYLLFDASQRLLEGDLSFLDTQYFQLWPYQMGFVAFQSLLLRLWNDILFLKLFNCLLGAATTLLVYLLARELAGERASRFVSLLYCLLPFPLFYVTVLTNQLPASFLSYLGIYIFLSSRWTLGREVRCLILGVLLALANILRPESAVPLLAAILYLLLTLRRENLKSQLRGLLILAAAYLALTRLATGLFTLTGLSPDGLVSNAPHWKFLLGFNHETMGRYSNADTIYLTDAAAAWALVKQRILVPIPQLLRLFLNKIACFWSGGDLSWSFGPFSASGLPLLGTVIDVNRLVDRLSGAGTCIAVALYVLVLLGLLPRLRRGDHDPRPLLLVNQVFVTFGVYLLIEVQPRYFYHIQISVMILAALGIRLLPRLLRRPQPSPAGPDNPPTPTPPERMDQ